MERRTVFHLLYMLATLVLLGLFAVVYMRTEKAAPANIHKEPKQCVDLMQIVERNRIDVSLGYNSLNYYILHGKPGGFQFELVRYFSNHLGVELNINVTNDISKAIDMLQSGEIDIVCADLTRIDGRFGNDVVFTEPYAAVSQVLVQRNNHPIHEVVNSVEGLNGKTIYIPKGSLFKQILRSVTSQLSQPPFIIEVSGYGSEQLIDAVADGIISFTIADFHLARYHGAIYKNLDVAFELGDQKPLAWCMRKSSHALLDTFNGWLTDFMLSRQFGYLYHRYFINPWKHSKFQGDFFSVKKGDISPYDKEIKKYSRDIGWDWRLIASLIYEESKFHHDLVSYAGAFGIMQLMPVTAETFGVGPESSAEEHIKAGIRFIQRMDNNFINDVPDKTERQKFVIASYNLGEGHIRDAMALAEKHRRSPQIWDNNVEFFLVAKSQTKYYQDEVVKYGYCKGQITSMFVKTVFERYEHYKNAFPE
jgi:membrane-bound lytic murein transglycosylase F